MKKIFATVVLVAAPLCVGTSWAMKLEEGDIVAVDRYNSGVVRIDPVTGAQEFIVFLALEGPRYIAVEADGRLIVTEEGLSAISRIDPVTGTVTIVAGGPISTPEGGGENPDFNDPTGVDIEADGGIIISERSGRRIYRIDPLTGDQTVLVPDGPPLDTPTGVAVEADGNIVTADGNAGVVRVHPVTGAQSLVTPLGPELFYPGGIAVEADGTLLVTDFFDDRLIRVNPSNGGQSVLSDFMFDEPQDVAVEADGGIIVATDGGLYRVDPVTGTHTLFSSSPSDDFIGVAVVPPLAPALFISGSCPGSGSLVVSNVTPGGTVALAWGTIAGPFVVPPGPCAGSTLGIADPRLLTVVSADATGTVSLDRSVGAGACGLLVQAADLATCTMTNLSSVP